VDYLHSYDNIGAVFWGAAPYAVLTDVHCRSELLSEAGRLDALLAGKEVSYDGLGSALMPSRMNHEVALIFDVSLLSGYANYATAVSQVVVGSLPAETSHAIATGDLLDLGLRDVRTAFGQLFLPAKGYEGDAVDCYGVHINNLEYSWLARSHALLSKHSAYVGMVICTGASPVRSYFANTLVPQYLKHGRIALSAHEEDVADNDDCYVGAWRWPTEQGYECRTVSNMHMSLFLTYKIEHEVTPGFAIGEALIGEVFGSGETKDYRASVASSLTVYINAMSLEESQGNVLPLLDSGEVADLLLNRIEQGYLYRLRQASEGVVSFQVALPFEPQGPALPGHVFFNLRYRSFDHRLNLVSVS
jgi:hypothetical protein